MVEEKIIFGINPILEILRSNPQKIRKIIVAEGRGISNEIVKLIRERHVPLQKLPRAALKKYTQQNHQGIIAIISASSYASEEDLISILSEKQDSLGLILDGIEDPRNLGAILRTAECAGVDAIFIPERRASGLTDTVAKTSAGAIEYVKVARVKNINNLIEKLKRSGIWVIGADAKAEIDYTEWNWTSKTALVIGSEGKGLHHLTKQRCDALVKIPVFGKIESLNVSVATAVILYEIIRQRNLHKDSLSDRHA
jgi:23S rRNA (guanosine2251-2'-O)-methyltransferase